MKHMLTAQTHTELFKTYLSLGHDVKVVAVKGEGHVSQDRASIFNY